MSTSTDERSFGRGRRGRRRLKGMGEMDLSSSPLYYFFFSAAARSGFIREKASQRAEVRFVRRSDLQSNGCPLLPTRLLWDDVAAIAVSNGFVGLVEDVPDPFKSNYVMKMGLN